MSYDAKVYNVMIASPSDVQIERNIVREVIHEWNSINSSSQRIVLLPLGWETHSAPVMGDRPQEIINSQVLAESDLLVAVFWTRIGTPTGKAISGTVEEIEKHIAAGKPAMIYFSSAPVRPDSVDGEQYKALQEFKKACQDRGLVETYETTSEFRDKFSRQLSTLLKKHEYFSEIRADGIEEHRVDGEDIPGLTREAKEILVEASQDTSGTVMKLPYIGGFMVQTNSREFVEHRNPRSRALWEGAIEELCNFGLLEPRGHKDEIFGVTREGYRIADLLRNS